jgi:crossover junction endodeoxyribonuclease RuvC
VLPDDLVPDDCPWPVLLGVDPGTRVAGFGAIVLAPSGPRLVACGVIRTPAKADIAVRLAKLAEELRVVLRRLRPSLVVVEGVFAARNVRSALRIGEARGAVLATAAAEGRPVVEIAPAAAKKALVGNGNASKEQVASMVGVILGVGELDVPLDATDALALAIAHARRIELAEVTDRGAGSVGNPRNRP